MKLEPWSIMDTRHNGPGVKRVNKYLTPNLIKAW